MPACAVIAFTPLPLPPSLREDARTCDFRSTSGLVVYRGSDALQITADHPHIDRQCSRPRSPFPAPRFALKETT